MPGLPRRGNHWALAAGLLIQCSFGSIICESCRYCAGLLHESLTEITEGQSNVEALISTALTKTSTVPPLPSLELTEAQRKDKCQRYFSADRYILRRFLAKDSTASQLDRSKVAEELCLQRLRCTAGDFQADRVSEASPSAAESPKVLPPRTTYEDLLATHSKVAGTRPKSQTAPQTEMSEAKVASGSSKPSDVPSSQKEICNDPVDASLEIRDDILQEIRTETGLPDDPLNPTCKSTKDSYEDLSSTRVVLVLFTGRRDRLRILMRYLRRDLRSAGGVVDKVIFALWQITPKDRSYIQEQLHSPEGSAFEVRDFTEELWGPPSAQRRPTENRMVALYQSLNETGTVYVKVDDDVVYVAEHAIANLVRERLRERCLLVSANVVNHAIMSAVHQERGAHRGFWPSAEQRRNPSMRLPWKKVAEINLSPEFIFERFPASRCVVERWDCAALVHESFLDRASDKTLCVFDFGWYDFNRAGYREHKYIHRSPSINKEYWSQGARWSTNFFAFKASDLSGVDWQSVYGKGDDEEEFTGPHAERRDRHSCAVGSALVVHFSYGSQEQGLMAYTNLLKRYDKLSRRVQTADSARTSNVRKDIENI